MYRYMRAFVICTAISMIVLSACGAPRPSSAEQEMDNSIMATVGDTAITREDIQEELNRIPPYQRTNFETPQGQRVLLEHMVERLLLLQAAEDAGLEEDSFVVAQVEQAMRQVEAAKQRALIQTYYEKMVVDSVEVPEDSILAYYEQHKDDMYHQDNEVKVSHILSETEEDLDQVSQMLESGTAFADVADSLSAHAPTAGRGGELGWVTESSPFPYMGNQPEIAESLFAADSGDVLGPFQTELGYHFFKVNEKKEEGTKPLEQVRESIAQVLRPPLVNNYFQGRVMPSLHERYGVTINEQAFLPDESVPADSLMSMAQGLMERDPQRAVEYFELFLQRFPEHEKAHQAQFLIGFTYSEYLGDYEAAREAFTGVADNYPESELADDAEWMIDNMDRPPEELLPPEGDVDSLIEIEEGTE
ncbi:tetratricopeptide repeat protein [Candidatus Fermentibacteria bacterium]|nr:tetratricopeptide repeat protein [Candidatus Fermentibacteria bacterium]